MKTIKNPIVSLLSMLLAAFVLITACTNDETEVLGTEPDTSELSSEDKNALLFMLEEEKLARDTYEFLDGLYGTNQFANIKLSEQSHIDAVVALLNRYKIDYTILPYGEFYTTEIQGLYDQFVAKGRIDAINALKVGATIEDLDIVDLDEFINATSNTSIISVFESLQCGSRNHLRSFVGAIENSNETYEPQFLSIEEYNEIINGLNEKCGG
ncbi:MAG: DUF2202 domain-containing protein [Eudoraea sp.]|nr:DUF2202 domain-containing protein [Eudoraea sp.]